MTNLHTHSTFCDGKDTPEDMVLAAIDRGFDVLGFSSHAMLPEALDFTLDEDKARRYAAEVRALAKKYADRIEIRLGVEADFIPPSILPDRSRYAFIAPDYIIGSIHFVIAPDGIRVPVDHALPLLAEGIEKHFGGDGEAVVRAYLAALRDMVAQNDFDIVGHPDLYRKFNGRLRFFDESAPWYRDELVRTADALAASGKTVEINTGGIARGWMDDAYPSAFFRALLRERGVRMILSSDAHSAAAIDCSFDRFAGEVSTRNG